MKAKNNFYQTLVASFFLLIFLSVALWAVDNTKVALLLMEHPVLILSYLSDKFGYLKLFGGGLITIFMFSLLLIKPQRNLHHHNQNVLSHTYP